MSCDFEVRTEGLELGGKVFDAFPEFLRAAGYDNTLLALQLTYGGMGCGPIWVTDVFGFDFGTLREEEE